MIIMAMLAASMMTTWGEKVTSDNCYREYPRPQMVRTNWTSLCGDWDYAVTSVTNTPGRPVKWDGRIRVPYAIESQLSGVGRLLEPDEFLWYTRKFDLGPGVAPGERLLLHFEGVDYRAQVYIGHTEVTDVPHEGGVNPFTLDITDYVKPGENELTVCVWDPTGTPTSPDAINPRGKQALKPHGCFYTRVSGIWLPVWMERVPERYIKSFNVVTDIDRGEVKFEFDKVGEGEVEVTHDMPKDFECWSPENPKLYHFTAKYGKDEVKGYFAMRKFSKAKDEKGVLRFYLNNKPYFVMGTLDQGWWPDGLLTPPSVEAMRYDIETLKKCGYNTMRKHIKREPMTYYAQCDELGILVLQDMVCANGDWRGPWTLETVKGYGEYRAELKELIDGLRSVPSIVMWVPYNEGWGQPGEHLTHSTLDFVSRYDATRLVNGPSGAEDFEGGELLGPQGWNDRIPTKHKPAGECEAADAVDYHLYRGPGMHAVNDRRVSFLGEFGGLGQPTPGHMWKEAGGSWGYGGVADTSTREGLEKAYLGLMNRLAMMAANGLAGAIYTQTTDVEVEINGIMTYDRKVLKFDPAVLAAAHRRVSAAALGDVRFSFTGACTCGVAAERSNDFYWENDKFGMRAYGPGEYHKWSGLDVFNKMPGTDASVELLLANPGRCGNWHLTPWKGILDNYTVGASRGCGGVALWGDGEWKTYIDWEKSEIVSRTGDRVEFKLKYAPFSAMGGMTYHIVLEKGSRFFKNTVTFEKGWRKDFRVGPGLDLGAARDHHGVIWEDAKLGVVSLFEDPKNDVEGSTATAIIIDPADAGDIELMTDNMGSRVLALKKNTFTYYAGAAWSKGGEITTAEEWRKCIEDFRKGLK